MSVQKSDETQNELENAIEIAEELLRKVTYTKGERSGRITATRLRKIHALATENDLFKAFRYKILYLVQRNTHYREKELEEFAENLLKRIEQHERQMEFARLITQYAIMVYAAKEVEGK